MTKGRSFYLQYKHEHNTQADTKSGTSPSPKSQQMPCLGLRIRGCSVLRRHTPATASTSSRSLPRGRFESSISGHQASGIREVPTLPSWDVTVFSQAYKQNVPAGLPRSRAHLPPACSKWFIHDDNPDYDLFSPSSTINVTADRDSGEGRRSSDGIINVPRSSELRTSFWSGHEATIVPLEITTTTTTTTKDASAATVLGQDSSIPGAGGESEGFERIEAPLQILVAYLSKSPPPQSRTRIDQFRDVNSMSIYLAQCDLSSLPVSIRSDVPVPEVLYPSSSSGSNSDGSTVKGDIYASSLWLGRPPTYTPLHRDPNPNLFIQLAGQKTIRLLPPQIGDALYHDVSARLSPTSTSFSAAIRGEEMMVGPQKVALHDAIWNPSSIYNEVMRTHGLQTTLGLGDALFTPKGWWHSVKGVGDGVTASVNWWFR
ncbi:JmjC domain protein [Fonsecaea pedrosoi]|nr:JmjC domain protein [Fonsecaea pedrosoi]